VRAKALTIVGLAAVLAAPAAGAPQPKPLLRQAAASLVAAGAPGVEVLVNDGKTTVRFAAGVSNRTTKTPLRSTDPFRVGSLTKSFVATVVLQLAGEGKLGLDDSVERWLPGLVPNGAAVTLRELLSHRSGIFDYVDDQRVFDPYLTDPGFTWQPRELVALAVSHPAGFAPGARYEYSNTNYVLLGLVIEAATGDTVGAELQQRVFTPLGLSHTSYAPNAHPPDSIAHGYLLSQRPQLDTTFYSASYADAAGAIVSTVDDLAHFYRALLGGRLLAAPLLVQMENTRPISRGSGYGLGLLRLRLSCGTFLGHTGDIPGYSTFAFATRDGKHQFVVAVTADGFGRKAQAAYNVLVERAACG
jgi:D-alanyl-D-alanine carboxypeptidase